MCKISIIVPAYNAEEFIGCMIQTVLSQPVKTELIIVNDGSRDRTADICAKYSDQIKLINITNHGAGYARNIGIEAATGDYVIFLDSDDMLIPNSINESLLAYLALQSEEKTDIVYSKKCASDFSIKNQVESSYSQKISTILYHMPLQEFVTGIYRRDFLISNNIRFFEYQEQDIESAFRYRTCVAAKKIKTNNDICFYLQRENMQSNTHTFNYRKLYRIKALVYKQLYDEARYMIKAPKCDRVYLQWELCQSLIAYFNYLLKYGYGDETVNSVQTMRCALLSNGKLYGSKKYFLDAYHRKAYSESVKQFAKIKKLVLGNEIPKYTNVKENKSTKSNDICSADEIMNRWRKLNNF